MEDIIYHIEKVEPNTKANWPNEDDYTEPSKQGYLFDGWDFDWQNNNITADTDICAKWDKLYIRTNSNHIIANANGDTDDDLTTLEWWVQSNKGIKIANNVVFEEVELVNDETPIVFEERGVSVVDNKNVKTIKISENASNSTRLYKFCATCVEHGLLSDVCIIQQPPKDVILFPYFDYLTFTCTWGEEDGGDADSALVFRNTDISTRYGIQYNLDDMFFGFRGNTFPFNKYVTYSGDTQTSGNESMFVNFRKILDDGDFINKGINVFYIDIYANWATTRGNGNVSVNFCTFRGSDGMDFNYNTHMFDPKGNTVQNYSYGVNSNAYANSSFNVLDIPSVADSSASTIQRNYSKLLTIEYDVLHEETRVIKNTQQSGRTLFATAVFDTVPMTISMLNSKSTDINKNEQDKYFTISSIVQTIDGVSSTVDCSNATIGYISHMNNKNTGIPSFTNCAISSSSDNEVTFVVHLEENDTGYTRKCVIPITIQDAVNHTVYKFEYTINQTA